MPTLIILVTLYWPNPANESSGTFVWNIVSLYSRNKAICGSGVDLLQPALHRGNVRASHPAFPDSYPGSVEIFLPRRIITLSLVRWLFINLPLVSLIKARNVNDWLVVLFGFWFYSVLWHSVDSRSIRRQNLMQILDRENTKISCSHRSALKLKFFHFSSQK